MTISFKKNIVVLMAAMGPAFFIAGSLNAQTPAVPNDTIALLTAGNTLQVSSQAGVLYQVFFDSTGRYQTSTGSAGSWQVLEGQLCTTRDADGASSCAQLPAGKALNESWETTDANGVSITAEIIPPQTP